MNRMRKLKYCLTLAKRRSTLLWRYCAHDVWDDTSSSPMVQLVKIGNLAIRSILDTKLQQQACALTYRTVLAIVPALAMLFAIGRGFGFQNIMQSELARYFPAQQQALDTASTFVDNYLQHASQGIFVGIGVVFLLWTLISLMGNVERSFNHIWGVRKDRSYANKVTDYTALLIILPVLLVCSAGLSIFMSNAVQQLIPQGFITPLARRLLDWAPALLTCLFFTAAFWIVPNTKVRFRYALIAGVLTGVAFMLVEWIFMTGQLYVSNYNAIYGSFAFVLLLLVWMQLSWTVTLAGVVLSFSMQNVYNYNYNHDIGNIAHGYARDVTLLTLSLIAHRFETRQSPLTATELSRNYGMPIILAGKVLQHLVSAHLVTEVRSAKHYAASTYVPAFSTQLLTIGAAQQALDNAGEKRFVTELDDRFASAFALLGHLRANEQAHAAAPITSLLTAASDSRQKTAAATVSSL